MVPQVAHLFLHVRPEALCGQARPPHTPTERNARCEASSEQISCPRNWNMRKTLYVAIPHHGFIGFMVRFFWWSDGKPESAERGGGETGNHFLGAAVRR